jgi:hypothetical protein
VMASSSNGNAEFSSGLEFTTGYLNLDQQPVGCFLTQQRGVEQL